MTLKAFLSKQMVGQTGNVAGYFGTSNKGNLTFYYVKSDREHLPAAAFLLDYLGKGNRDHLVFSNITEDHWIRSYFGDNVIPVARHGNGLVNQWGAAINAAKLPVTCSFTMPSPPVRPAPLAQGGLYQAAVQMQSELGSREGPLKGLQRVTRYYMLAAYALLGRCALKGYEGGNYVAAIMVDDKGSIIGHGINNGRARSNFHHAEVNLILDYLSRNPMATGLPEKSLIFSTLTPCMQCSTFLQKVKPANSLVFFGQKDTGGMGSEGEKYFSALSDTTKPLNMRGVKPGKADIHKVQVEQSLSDCMGRGMIAKQIGSNAAFRLKEAFAELQRKSAKVRTAESQQEQMEYDIKQAVLGYLKPWVEGLNLP